MELNIKEERAAKAIAELQDRLIESRRDRKDMEIEFIALKKNYYQVKQELDQEKLKSENINIELINLVNENNILDINRNFKNFVTELNKSYTSLTFNTFLTLFTAFIRRLEQPDDKNESLNRIQAIIEALRDQEAILLNSSPKIDQIINLLQTRNIDSGTLQQVQEAVKSPQ